MSQIAINIREKVYPGSGQAQDHVAIANLEINLNPHEFVCLVGPSGCGKTTLLNILSGLDKDYQGSIQQVSRESESKKPRMGYIFQEPRLLPWRTVRENLLLTLPKHIANPEAHVDFYLEAVGLKQAEHVYPERLSLGMSRRVALARGFAVEPDLLLMDEPFVSLDAPTARRISELLVELWHLRPHTVLFVTHNLREAIMLADRLVFLSAPPTHVIESIPITIPRAERNESSIEAFRQQLISDFPLIHQLL